MSWRACTHTHVSTLYREELTLGLENRLIIARRHHELVELLFQLNIFTGKHLISYRSDLCSRSSFLNILHWSFHMFVGLFAISLWKKVIQLTTDDDYRANLFGDNETTDSFPNHHRELSSYMVPLHRLCKSYAFQKRKNYSNENVFNEIKASS